MSVNIILHGKKKKNPCKVSMRGAQCASLEQVMLKHKMTFTDILDTQAVLLHMGAEPEGVILCPRQHTGEPDLPTMGQQKFA